MAHPYPSGMTGGAYSTHLPLRELFPDWFRIASLQENAISSCFSLSDRGLLQNNLF